MSARLAHEQVKKKVEQQNPAVHPQAGWHPQGSAAALRKTARQQFTDSLCCALEAACQSVLCPGRP